MVETAHQQARHSNNSLSLSNIINPIILLITFLLRLVVWPLKRISGVLFPPKEYDGITATADQAARAFASYFEKHFIPNVSPNTNNHMNHDDESGNNDTQNNNDGNNTDLTTQNPFQTMGYAKALVESYRQKKILLVYLHSPLHAQSERFCARILSHPRVLTLLNGSFVSWGGSIHTGDGANVAQMLNVSTYPYVALLACGGTGGSRVDLLWKMEGNNVTGTVDVDNFLRGINMVLRGFQNVMAELEARRLRREEEVRLRQEQDREFQETLLADQQRERERQAKEQAEREAREAKERAEQEAILKKQQQLEECQQILTPEPAQGTPGTARLRITLPSGTKIDRRFHTSDQIKHVEAFLTIWLHENDVKIENFVLSSTYPKRAFNEKDITLEEGGLCPDRKSVV